LMDFYKSKNIELPSKKVKWIEGTKPKPLREIMGFGIRKKPSAENENVEEDDDFNSNEGDQFYKDLQPDSDLSKTQNDKNLNPKTENMRVDVQNYHQEEGGQWTDPITDYDYGEVRVEDSSLNQVNAIPPICNTMAGILDFSSFIGLKNSKNIHKDNHQKSITMTDPVTSETTAEAVVDQIISSNNNIVEQDEFVLSLETNYDTKCEKVNKTKIEKVRVPKSRVYWKDILEENIVSAPEIEYSQSQVERQKSYKEKLKDFQKNDEKFKLKTNQICETNRDFCAKIRKLKNRAEVITAENDPNFPELIKSSELVLHRKTVEILSETLQEKQCKMSELLRDAKLKSDQIQEKFRLQKSREDVNNVFSFAGDVLYSDIDSPEELDED
jgi:hypothetical protein